MGAEMWVLFASQKQAAAAKAFLAPLRDPDDYAFAGLGDDSGSCWLRWDSPLKLEVGYSFGGAESNRAAAMATCRELANRFKIRKIGADSVGWYKDTDWGSSDPFGAPARYGEYDSWVDWVKAWNVEWSTILWMLREHSHGGSPDHDQVFLDIDHYTEILGKVDANITNIFKGLDSKGAV